MIIAVGEHRLVDLARAMPRGAQEFLEFVAALEDRGLKLGRPAPGQLVTFLHVLLARVDPGITVAEVAALPAEEFQKAIGAVLGLLAARRAEAGRG